MAKRTKGIDVSHWNGSIDFTKVKSAGYDFVIIKAGGSDAGCYKDSKFETNYAAAVKAGLSVGAYYFVGNLFYGAEAGEADAIRFIAQLSGKKFDYPVYLDVETTQPTRRDEATQAAAAFCDVMEGAGYFVGVYASAVRGFRECLNHADLTKYAHWVAHYGAATLPDSDAGIWQYSSKGKVPGINGNVDLDYSYIDYSKIIKNKGLNGYKKKGTKTNDNE